MCKSGVQSVIHQSLGYFLLPFDLVTTFFFHVNNFSCSYHIILSGKIPCFIFSTSIFKEQVLKMLKNKLSSSIPVEAIQIVSLIRLLFVTN